LQLNRNFTVYQSGPATTRFACPRRLPPTGTAYLVLGVGCQLMALHTNTQTGVKV
jgi:hypothetical protein